MAVRNFNVARTAVAYRLPEELLIDLVEYLRAGAYDLVYVSLASLPDHPSPARVAALRTSLQESLRPLLAGTATLARGGPDQMTALDWQRVAQRTQAAFAEIEGQLTAFQAGRPRGKLHRPATRREVANDLATYVQGQTRALYWESALGDVEQPVRRKLSPVEHCRTCPGKARVYSSFAAMVAEVGLPGDGSDQCHGNCACWIEALAPALAPAAKPRPRAKPPAFDVLKATDEELQAEFERQWGLEKLEGKEVAALTRDAYLPWLKKQGLEKHYRELIGGFTESGGSEASAALKLLSEKQTGVRTWFHNVFFDEDEALRAEWFADEAEAGLKKLGKRALAEKFVQVQRNYTRYYLRRMSPDPSKTFAYTLRRGVTRGFFEDQGATRPSLGSSFDYLGNSLESWTASAKVAEEFASQGGGVLAAQISGKDVFATSLEHFEGSPWVYGKSQAEWIVLPPRPQTVVMEQWQ